MWVDVEKRAEAAMRQAGVNIAEAEGRRADAEPPWDGKYQSRSSGLTE